MQFSLAVLVSGALGLEESIADATAPAAGCECSVANPYCNIGDDLPAFFYNLNPRTQWPRYGYCYNTWKKEVQQRGTRGVPCFVRDADGRGKQAPCTRGANLPKPAVKEAWVEGPPVPTTRRDDVPETKETKAAPTVRSSEPEASLDASSSSDGTTETWATRLPLPSSPRVGGVGSLSPQHTVPGLRGDSAPSALQHISGRSSERARHGPASDQARGPTTELEPRRKPSSHSDPRLTPSVHASDSSTATLDRGDSSSHGARIQPAVHSDVSPTVDALREPPKPSAHSDSETATVNLRHPSSSVEHDFRDESSSHGAHGNSDDSVLSWLPPFEGGDGAGSDRSMLLAGSDSDAPALGGGNFDWKEDSGAHGGLTMDVLAGLPQSSSPVERWLEQRNNGPVSHASEVDPMGSPTVRTTRKSRPSVPLRPSLPSHVHEDYLRAGAGRHEPHALDRDYKCCHRPRALESAELTCRIPKAESCDALGFEDRANGLCTPWCADALAEQRFVHDYLHAASTRAVLTPANHAAAERVRERLAAHGHAVVEEEMDCCACPHKPGPRYLSAKPRSPCRAPAGTCEALGLKQTWAHGRGGCAAFPKCGDVPVASVAEAEAYCGESEA